MDKTAAATLNADGEQLKSRYRDLAVDYHAHDRLDGAGDAAKQALVAGATWHDLGLLSQISIIPEGKFASLQTKLAQVGTCKTFRPDYFDRDYTCPDCRYRPTKTDGPTARAAVSAVEDTADSLRIEFLEALADSLAEPELAAGIPLLTSGQNAVRDFIATRRLPEGVTEEFVAAANQLLQRFSVVKVDRDGLWSSVMAGATSLTPEDLAARFATWLDQDVIKGEDRARVRIVPTEGNAS